MFRFPSVICTRCTGFFCLAIIKGPPNDIYCIIEEPYKHYFTEKVSYSHENYVFRCHGKDFRECFEQFEKATIFDGMTIYDAESEIEVLFG